ncbi:MAG: hypothetical protein JWN86_3921 [Planctomycetota bacterium]|nr:hypothetical protein [Planctomycetota bacterium]
MQRRGEGGRNREDLWPIRVPLAVSAPLRETAFYGSRLAQRRLFRSTPIHHLGLEKTGSRHIRNSLGAGEAAVFEAVRLTIQGRDCTVDVMEVPDGTPILIGQVPLELMDFVGDPCTHRLIGDPRHGGEYIIEMY